MMFTALVFLELRTKTRIALASPLVTAFSKLLLLVYTGNCLLVVLLEFTTDHIFHNPHDARRK